MRQYHESIQLVIKSKNHQQLPQLFYYCLIILYFPLQISSSSRFTFSCNSRFSLSPPRRFSGIFMKKVGTSWLYFALLIAYLNYSLLSLPKKFNWGRGLSISSRACLGAWKNLSCPTELQNSLQVGDLIEMVEKSRSLTNSDYFLLVYSISRKGLVFAELKSIFLMNWGSLVQQIYVKGFSFQLFSPFSILFIRQIPYIDFYCRLQSNIYIYQFKSATRFILQALAFQGVGIIMKLDKLLEDTIKIKINPRKPLFFTRVKLFLWSPLGEWIENCNGLLILYSLNSSNYLTIMNIIKFRIDFDMELYTNFIKYAKFIGENRSMQFFIPCEGQNITGMMILQSKQELTELKRNLEECFYKGDNSEQLQFFKRPEVQELIKLADITEETLEDHMKLRKQAEEEIKNYFKELDQLERSKKSSGFKAYGLGREEWKLQQNEKEYLKEKKKADVVAYLTRLNKQNKML